LEMKACASGDEQEKKSERMYECLVKAKKVLFGDRTMVFWSKQELTRFWSEQELPPFRKKVLNMNLACLSKLHTWVFFSSCEGNL